MSRKNEARQLTEAQEHLAKGDFKAARLSLKKLLKSDPDNAHGSFLLGNAYMREGNLEKARDSIRKAVELSPDSADYLNGLGVLLHMMHEYAEAATVFRRALALSPANMEIVGNLGILLRHTGYHDEALNCLRTVRMSGRAPLKVLEELGEELIRQSELTRALNLFDRIRKKSPKNVYAINRVALIKAAAGRWDEAENDWRSALAIEPKNAEIYGLRGVALMNRGDMDAAIVSIEKALTLNPGLAGANFIWAHMAGESDSAAMTVEAVYESVKIALNDKGVSFDDWANLSFAAGKLASLLKQYDAAFGYYDLANKALWQRFPMPEEYFTRRARAVIDAFGSTFFTTKMELVHRSPEGKDKAGEGLVFVFGMPRSGTTLGEHILARSTDVFPGGEREDIEDLFDRLFSFSSDPDLLVGKVGSLDLKTVRQIAADHHEKVASYGKGATWFIDKTPRNHMLLGFLAVLFPRAKFIHCNRDPVDTCLSCYFNYFILHSQKFTYDLAMLAKVYKLYQEMMAHWRNVLPVPIYELVYEDVVTSPEEQIRAYTEFCGLEWDECFLATAANQHTVTTASVVQVRKPIYTGSVQRWRRYEAHLQPLLQDLGLA